MNYFSRVFPPEVFGPCAQDFDKEVFETFRAKLGLPSLNDVARQQLLLPVFLGGFGLRSMYDVSAVAWWSALAQYFHLISPLAPSPDSFLVDSKVPFVKSQFACHKVLSDSKVKLPRPFPSLAENFFVDFTQSPPSSGIQRKILLAINKHRLKTLISSFHKHSPDRARFNSLSDKHSSSWLSTPPISPSFILPNQVFHVACRIRLGMVPFDDCPLYLWRVTPFSSSPLSFL